GARAFVIGSLAPLAGRGGGEGHLVTHLLDYLADRVVLCDGAMGTQVQARNLDVERDFLGLENCTEIVCESRPDLVREIHRGYLEAGCDTVQTNSFGGSPGTLGEV